MEIKVPEELSFTLDLLNLATRLENDAAGKNLDPTQEAVHVLRITPSDCPLE